MRWFLTELVRRDRVLAIAGGEFVTLLLVMLAAAAVDQREVLGINVWVKPIKFAASITIYLWTLAWLLGELPGPAWCKAWIRWGATTMMVTEIACIAGQSARGAASHFNSETPLDDVVFTVMGAAILFNTLLEIMLLAMFFQRGLRLAPAYLWGIRLGIIGALLSAAVGIAMIVHGAHTVGAADGGPGLWLVNWSTEAGDLRVAHALGLHALQILPLAGYFARRIGSPRAALASTIVFAMLYGAAAGWMFWQAVEGRPPWRASQMAAQPMSTPRCVPRA